METDSVDPATPLTWCSDCRKMHGLHPLVHLIDAHAPRIGDTTGRSYADRSWRTAELQGAS